MVKVVVAGGGTAGHIEPAMAVAEALREQGAEVIALGTEKGLEKNIVPARGFELKLIRPVPMPRKINGDLLRLPMKLLKTIQQTRAILRDHQAQVLVGFGGYVAAPAYLAARSLGIPMLVHEANARAGMANKLGVRLGGIGLNAVENSGLAGDVVGIPIRAELQEDQQEAKARGLEQWGLDPDRLTILVTGGSQGAASINRALEECVDELTERYQVLHAYGPKNAAPSARLHYVPVDYIRDMSAAYAVADVIVCRSGAMTVAEITASATPAIYVPLPIGNGEQQLNAQPIVDQGGARMLQDSDVTGPALISAITEVFQQDTYATMVTALKNSPQGNAAQEIAGRALALASKKGN